MVPVLPRLLPIGGSPNLLALLATHAAAVVPLWQALFARSEGLWAMARPRYEFFLTQRENSDLYLSL